MEDPVVLSAAQHSDLRTLEYSSLYCLVVLALINSRHSVSTFWRLMTQVLGVKLTRSEGEYQEFLELYFLLTLDIGA